ncbi:MAG: FG-GAP-like repeat-containing protein, partial [Firmicutes bacterium]|nr:FG-GAP-like repeat-containing protein [Bacillota bacterium]
MPRRALLVFFVLFTLVLAAAPGRPAGESFTATLGEEVDPDNPATRAPDGEGDTKLTAHGDFDQPDLFTGTASYRYELKLPPGTAGMEPKLALVYRSTNDNGWFGMGWELEGLGYIEYNYKFGVPRYDGTDKDFVLKMGSATYELVPDDSNQDGGPGYYHTECETWMKIYFDGISWTVTDRNGVRWRFGGTPDSRIPIVDHNFIRLWALDRVEDVHGNYMTYSYVLDAPNGEYYPDKIVYTQNTRNTLRKLKTVSFIREPRTDNVRPHARWMTHRIKEIRVDIDGTLIERWVLNYRYSNCTYRSLLGSITRYGSGSVPETTSFTYAADSGSLTWRQGPTQPVMTTLIYGEINGDGLLDYLVYRINANKGEITDVYINKGDATYLRYPINPAISLASTDIVTPSIKLKDINGDGKEDIDFYDINFSNKKTIFINRWRNGPSWVLDPAWQNMEPNANHYYSYHKVKLDFNNDGVIDTMEPGGPGATTIALSSAGAGWTLRTDYLVTPYPYHYAAPGGIVYIDFLEVDYNGDGWPDLYVDNDF